MGWWERRLGGCCSRPDPGSGQELLALCPLKGRGAQSEVTRGCAHVLTSNEQHACTEEWSGPGERPSSRRHTQGKAKGAQTGP